METDSWDWYITKYVIKKDRLPEDVISEVVCSKYFVPVDVIYKKTRKKDVVEPRQVVQTILRNGVGIRLESVGLRFSQDRATVLHALKASKTHYEVEPEFRTRFDKILSEVNSRLNTNYTSEKLLVYGRQ